MPGTDRWWDGTAWTAHTRPVQAQVPAAGFGPPAAAVSRKGSTLALATVGVVVVAAVATGAVLLGKDDEGAKPKSAPSVSDPAASTADPKNSQATTPPATDDSTLLIDQLNGITLPVPDGWEKPDSSLD